MTDLTPAQAARLDPLQDEAMRTTDEQIAAARGLIAGQPDAHHALLAIDQWYGNTDPVDARDALPVVMYRAALLAEELEADRIGWEQDRAELAGARSLLAEATAERGAGYALAVERLRDDERYRNWWSPRNDQPTRNIRLHLADYLETVGAEPAAAEVSGQ